MLNPTLSRVLGSLSETKTNEEEFLQLQAAAICHYSNYINGVGRIKDTMLVCITQLDLMYLSEWLYDMVGNSDKLPETPPPDWNQEKYEYALQLTNCFLYPFHVYDEEWEKYGISCIYIYPTKDENISLFIKSKYTGDINYNEDELMEKLNSYCSLLTAV